jgi:hypothetical protein
LVRPLRSRLPHRKFTIAIDITYQSYYGEEPNVWIHGYKLVKGARGCYKFIVVSIVACSKKLHPIRLTRAKDPTWYHSSTRCCQLKV